MFFSVHGLEIVLPSAIIDILSILSSARHLICFIYLASMCHYLFYWELTILKLDHQDFYVSCCWGLFKIKFPCHLLDAATSSPVSMILSVYTFLVFFSLIGLSCYHMCLISVGLTTNEDVRHFDGVA